MTITTNQVTITNSATLIATIPDGGATVFITNVDASITIYLGGSAVAANTGIQLLAGQSWSNTLSSDEDVYGIVASGTPKVHYFMNEAL